MEDTSKCQSFDAEIKGRFDASNQVFSLGVNIGIKSFEHLITISSIALGLLFSYWQGIFNENVPHNPGHGEKIAWFVAVIFFSLTILASIKRNYYAGNELVNLAHYMRSKAFKRIHPENEAYLRNQLAADEAKREAVIYRRRWSAAARIFFYWAISSFAVFVVIDDIINFVAYAMQQLPVWIFSIPIILNIIISWLFGKSIGKDDEQYSGESNSEKPPRSKVQKARRKTKGDH
ncbi:MAG: hypothetical protein PHH13_00225 [Candidatus Peribacteraceae bacterium]|nr:hypothetical protein [Candidatus Peribacteraceae bacterium]